jgi:hypothetical protein
MTSGNSSFNILFKAVNDVISGSNKKRIFLSIYCGILVCLSVFLIYQGSLGLGYASNTNHIVNLINNFVGGLIAIIVGILFFVPTFISQLTMLFVLPKAYSKFSKRNQLNEEEKAHADNINPLSALIINTIFFVGEIILGILFFTIL